MGLGLLFYCLPDFEPLLPMTRTLTQDLTFPLGPPLGEERILHSLLQLPQVSPHT
jgi:hypothetical protein